MAKIAPLAICACLAASAPAALAWAQTPPPSSAIGAATGAAPDTSAPPEREHAVIGGKNIQPRSVPGEAGQSPEAQIRLLQKGARDLPPDEPIVVPHDIYGNPLGGNPGLNPPGLEAPPSTASHPPAPQPKP